VKHVPPGPPRQTRRVLLALVSGAAMLASLLVPAHAALAAAALPTDDQEIENRLAQMQPEVMEVARQPRLRDLVRTIARRQYDQDTDVYLQVLINEAEAVGAIDDPNIWWWQELRGDVNELTIDNWSYTPQILIPNLDENITLPEQPVVAIKPADETQTWTWANWVNQWGGIESVQVDEAYVESNEVWVLSAASETLGTKDGSTLTSGAPSTPSTSSAPAGPSANTFDQTVKPMVACNSTNLRNNKGKEYLVAWKVTHSDSFGGFLSGKTQLRLNVVSATGLIVKTWYTDKMKRKDASSGWHTVFTYVTTWDTAVIGSAMVYQWWYEGSGKTQTAGYSVPVPNGSGGTAYTINYSQTYQKNDKNGGAQLVQFSEPTDIEYRLGKVDFLVCSEGGDGGTGNDDLACGAQASASTTYSGYSAAKATDCNTDTRLGGQYSWANDWNTFPPNSPEWLQADLGVNKNFSRVVVYTSEGYPIRDYDIQAWNGSSFVTIGTVRGNTSLVVSTNVGAQNARLVRILGRSDELALFAG
jgi:hypothetical protein